MNLVPLSNNRIAITALDDGKTALFTCRWKDGDVRPDELDRIADGCRLMAARLRGVRPFDDGVEMLDDEIESTFNAAAPVPGACARRSRRRSGSRPVVGDRQPVLVIPGVEGRATPPREGSAAGMAMASTWPCMTLGRVIASYGAPVCRWPSVGPDGVLEAASPTSYAAARTVESDQIPFAMDSRGWLCACSFRCTLDAVQQKERNVTAIRKSRATGEGKRAVAAPKNHPLSDLLLGRTKGNARFSRDTSPPWMLINADVRAGLAELAAESVDCIVTSPPYFWQRDYGFEGQIGHEQTIDGYVTALRECFRELRRVLKKDGTFFLNIGDTYYSAKGKPHGKDDKHRGRMLARRTLRAVDGPGLGLPRKSLIGIPWRVALAMQEDGWTLRSDIVWRRPGSMPEPTAKDRPWNTHEHVFLFSTSSRYFFDRAGMDGEEDVWQIIARPDNPGSHFAPFPSALAERCVKCGCKPGGVVLDPFAGSGTTLLAARAFGHAAIGIEMSKGYCDFMETRLAQVPDQRTTPNGAAPAGRKDGTNTNGSSKKQKEDQSLALRFS